MWSTGETQGRFLKATEFKRLTASLHLFITYFSKVSIADCHFPTNFEEHLFQRGLSA